MENRIILFITVWIITLAGIPFFIVHASDIYLDGFIRIILFFIITVGLYRLFRRELIQFYRYCEGRLFRFIFSYMLLYLVLLLFFRQNIGYNSNNSNIDVSILQLSYFFIAMKPIDIFFQQLGIALLIKRIYLKYYTYQNTALSVLGIISLLHVGLFVFLPFSIALYLLLASCFGAFVFTYNFIHKKDGFIINYGIHLGFYMISIFVFYYIYN